MTLTVVHAKVSAIADDAAASAAGEILPSDWNSAHTVSGTLAATSVTGLATVATSGAYSDLTGRPTAASPSASVGTAAVNGSAATFMRSDAAPPLDVTANWPFTGIVSFNPTATVSPSALTWNGPKGSGSNNAAGSWTVVAPLSTGTATNPDLIFQTGVKTTSGSSLATATTAVTIKGETQTVVWPVSTNNSAEFYNTADQTTNYERLAILFTSNTATITTQKGGTGSGRQLAINVASGGILLQTLATTRFTVGANSIFSANVNGPEMVNGATSATAPAFRPNQSDTTTGIGAQAAGNISLIASGAEQMRVQSSKILMFNVPTSDPHVVSQVWNNAGVLTLSAG